MPRIYPVLPHERKQFFAVWYGLPEDKKESLYKAFQHKRCSIALWGSEEILSYHIPSLEEKIHLLLAYKYLDWIWFTALPESEDEPFTIYVCNNTPEDQGLDEVNDAFETSKEELQSLCKNMKKPKWVKKQKTRRVQVTIRSFPYKVQ
jgi:hypothetical protein